MKFRLPPATPFIVTVILLLIIVLIQSVQVKQGLEIKKGQQDVLTALEPKEEVATQPATESAEVEEAIPSPSPKSNAKRVVPSPLPEGK